MTSEKILKFLKAKKTWLSIANRFAGNTMSGEEIEIRIDCLEELITLINDYDSDEDLKFKVDSMIEIEELLDKRAEAVVKKND